MSLPTYRAFPSIEKFLVTVLGAATSTHVLTELPANFQDPLGPVDLMPLIVVDRLSGADLDPKMDRPVVDIDCYGSTRAMAQDLSELCRSYLRFELPGLHVPFEGAGVVVTRTRTIVGPRLLPHANPEVRRYVATYEFTLHPTP